MRIPDLDVAALSPEQKSVHDAILAGPRGVVQGPLRVWLASPELARLSQELGAFCRYATGLEPRLSELAIIVIGAHWRAGFEWHVHAPIAERAGIDPAAIAAIKDRADPPSLRPDERIVHDFTRGLMEERAVRQPVFDAARAAFGQRGVVELTGIIGYYTYIAQTIVAFEVDVPGGDPFAE